MKNKRKREYEAPSIEILTLENEGVIAASTGTEPMNPVNPSSARVNYASSSDLEDMLNDILTVE